MTTNAHDNPHAPWPIEPLCCSYHHPVTAAETRQGPTMTTTDTEVRAIRTLRAEGVVVRYVIDGRYLPWESALDALEAKGYGRVSGRGLLIAAEGRI